MLTPSVKREIQVRKEGEMTAVLRLRARKPNGLWYDTQFKKKYK